MILNHYVKQVGCMAVISCVFLLLLTSSNVAMADTSTSKIISNEQGSFPESSMNSVGIQNKHSRFIVRPSQKYYLQDPNKSGVNHENSVTRRSVNNDWKVIPIPPADSNSQIIVNLLAS